MPVRFQRNGEPKPISRKRHNMEAYKPTIGVRHMRTITRVARWLSTKPWLRRGRCRAAFENSRLDVCDTIHYRSPNGAAIETVDPILHDAEWVIGQDGARG